MCAAGAGASRTRLLAEIKDIRDELNMIRMVLQSQTQAMGEFADRTRGRSSSGRKSDEAADMQASGATSSSRSSTRTSPTSSAWTHTPTSSTTRLTHLLDLKQKHSNAFEARFARAQAVLQARQGQTIMVFTIVTIVFLPMSFIASVFSINIAEFPRQNGQTAVPWHYAAKFMCRSPAPLVLVPL